MSGPANSAKPAGAIHLPAVHLILSDAGCAALIMLMLSIAPESRLRSMVFWMIGDLSGAPLRPVPVPKALHRLSRPKSSEDPRAAASLRCRRDPGPTTIRDSEFPRAHRRTRPNR